MKGYKGMTKDMTCRGMKFEIGKTYHVDGEIYLCRNGLHFCEKLIDVMDFYINDGNNRYFEIEANGVIKTDGKKSVASSLTIIREIYDIELNKTIYNYGKSYGCGSGYGNGYSYGCGDGYGNSNGYGYGDGHHYSYGDGRGNGYGDAYCDGNGDGYGNGCNWGVSNIQKILK